MKQIVKKKFLYTDYYTELNLSSDYINTKLDYELDHVSMNNCPRRVFGTILLIFGIIAIIACI